MAATKTDIEELLWKPVEELRMTSCLKSFTSVPGFDDDIRNGGNVSSCRDDLRKATGHFGAIVGNEAAEFTFPMQLDREVF